MSYKNKQWLENEYITIGKKIPIIAKENNITKKTVHYWLRKFNIPKRKKTVGNFNKHPIGANNPNWKGDNVGYYSLHTWLKRHKPKSEVCEKCGEKKRLELANISGEYKRDINDFEWLCYKCHNTKDGIIENLKEVGKNFRFKKGQKAWNKNLPSEMQPNYGNKHSFETVEKMKRGMQQYWKNRCESLKKEVLNY